MAGKEVSTVSLPQKLETIFMQLEAFLSYRPERLVVKEIRSHLCYYTKNMKGAAKLRDAINHTANLAELKQILTQSFEEEHYG
jgi:tRNA-dihydrouridine synthase